MSDRELLELAAKAAGIVLVPYTWNKASPWGEHEGFTVSGEGPNEWNPLEDDGDALRLAVKLQLRVIPPEDEFGLDRASVRIAGRRDLVDAFHKDPCAATRRAIVRAAAEIGRQTP